MQLIATLGLAMGSSWVSGINLYAAILTLGLLSRFGHVSLPGELHVLTNWWVIGVACFMYCVEFLADKIPWVDSVWSAVHTFIRVPAGAALAAAAFGHFDPAIQVIAFLVGGGIALTSHGVKTVSRTVINASPEPFSNIAASLVGDAVAIGSMFLALFLPTAIIAVVTAAVIGSVVIIPKMISVVKHIYAKILKKPIQAQEYENPS